MKYRREIDGLRAVAILLVTVFHFDLFSVKNFPQLLSVQPCSSSAFSRDLHHQCIEISSLPFVQFGPVFQQRPP